MLELAIFGRVNSHSCRSLARIIVRSRGATLRSVGPCPKAHMFKKALALIPSSRDARAMLYTSTSFLQIFKSGEV